MTSSLSLFITSYVQSDFIGKMIFLALVLTSVITWTLIVHKARRLLALKKGEGWLRHHRQILSKKALSIDIPERRSPFWSHYYRIAGHAKQLLAKNRSQGTRALTSTDIEALSITHETSLSSQINTLSRNLYLLVMVVALAPFLGLLGTVWGILLSFSELHAASDSMREVVLSGLATALSTTVLGLVVAIPALIAHALFKAQIEEIEQGLEEMGAEVILAIELQYRAEPTHASA
jgi:biopolymer transport protein TolQ